VPPEVQRGRPRVLVYQPDFGKVGGIERHLLRFLRLLVRHGCDCTLLTITCALHASERAELRDLGVTLIEAAPGSKRPLVRALRLRRLVTRLAAGPAFDVVYTNATALSAWIVWKAFNGRGCRIVHHHHTSACDDERNGWPRLYPAALKAVPELIACARGVADRLARYRNGRPTRVLWYLADDLAATAPPLAAARRVDTPVVGFFGRAEPGKGIAWILALSREPAFQHVRFEVHGPAPQYADVAPATYPNVSFCGPYFDAAEHAARLHRVDCVVLPSLHVEGMPLTLMEAMSVGKPWVATDRGSVTELAIVPGDCIVTPPTLDGFRSGLSAMLDRLASGRVEPALIRAAYQTRYGLPQRERAWLEFFDVPLQPAVLRGGDAVRTSA
jgi:glycosyltransferase involved in cell wall biosynthesis